ncbi:S-adenosyl-L-methionine-dependent methyltransferases superfamily protein [Striga hermonthica]|uniref:S-adenosyl-L-methionine-dependent methyltransferases superfamily protein n=1 Tax=Striga hermonthica TaxID=68872 RepID=A0A9N7R5V8_STRHE|nr:S-adenosyl-L-methionine-dependent methyltransferases superfamily protein [Striga hermonthica]
MESTKGVAMAGGDDAVSYNKNSSHQRSVIEAADSLVKECIAQHIEPGSYPALQTFCIADLGCSTGPNTFTAVENIVTAVKLKCLNTNNRVPEFQVYFNDHVQNDFNTLFKSLPPNRDYYGSGVPGSFYARLFPNGSIHVAHCSYSLHWLSRVPREVVDRDSTAYNKGRIHYLGARDEVVDAYWRQHAVDISNFLEARAEELVPGGLLVLVIPARPDGVPHSKILMGFIFKLLGDCLVDLCRKGLIEEEKVDEFNLQLHFASPQELERVVNQNGRFTIERMESLTDKVYTYHIESIAQHIAQRIAQYIAITIRAITSEILKKQFGHEILDQLFGLLASKIEQNIEHCLTLSKLDLFVLLKRCEDAVVSN